MINDVWCACFSRYSFELLIWSANRTMPYTMPTTCKHTQAQIQVARSTRRDLRVSMELHDRQLKPAPNFSKKCINLGKNGAARYRRPINHCVVQRDNPQKIVLTITLQEGITLCVKACVKFALTLNLSNSQIITEL